DNRPQLPLAPPSWRPERSGTSNDSCPPRRCTPTVQMRAPEFPRALAPSKTSPSADVEPCLRDVSSEPLGSEPLLVKSPEYFGSVRHRNFMGIREILSRRHNCRPRRDDYRM